MNAMWMIVICLINFGISWWNAYVVGRMWGDRLVMGGFMKLVLYSAALMSALGFSSVFIVVLTLGAAALLEPEQGQLLVRYTMSSWYVLAIFPWLASGIVITLHSWVELFRTRSWVNFATTSWNTFAMAKNIYDATQNVGPAIDTVTEMLGSLVSGDSDNKNAAVARLAIALVLLSIVGGFLLTAMIIRSQAAKHRIPSEALEAAGTPASFQDSVPKRGTALPPYTRTARRGPPRPSA